MSKKQLIIPANPDPDNPEEFSAPLFQAMAVAAMSHRVEAIFTVPAGVVNKVCTPAPAMRGKELIEAIDESIGVTCVTEEAMNDNTVSFAC